MTKSDKTKTINSTMKDLKQTTEVVEDIKPKSKTKVTKQKKEEVVVNDNSSNTTSEKPEKLAKPVKAVKVVKSKKEKEDKVYKVDKVDNVKPVEIVEIPQPPLTQTTTHPDSVSVPTPTITTEEPEDKPVQKKRGRRPLQKPEGYEKPVKSDTSSKKKGKNPKESYGLNEDMEEDDPFFNQQEPEPECIETPIIRLNVTASDIRKIKDPNSSFDDGDNEMNIPSAFGGTEDFSYFQNNNKEAIPSTVTETDLQQLRANREKELESAETSSNESKLLCQYIEHNKKNTWPEKSVYDCMWCRYPFDNTPWAIPHRLTFNNKFEVFGNFCSPNCAVAYIFDHFDDDEMWDRYALLNMLYQKVYDCPGAIVKSAPDVLFLKKLGGILTIEEFREISGNQNKNYYIKMPPMVSIIPSVEELQQTSLFNDNTTTREHLNKELMMKANEELRLRRAKPIYDDTNTLDNYFHIS
jgi:hypothetical protein